MSREIEQAAPAEVDALINSADTEALLTEQLLIDLAALSPIDYDRKRKSAADTLGIRVDTLDAEVEKRRPKAESTGSGKGRTILLLDPEPWPSSIAGAALLDALLSLVERYVILPAGAAVAIALWVLHTYLLDAAEASPILAITSPEKRCGKTVVLETLQLLVRRPLPAANITPAALFRTIESCAPSLLIDEADTFLPDNNELRGVLNSGHRRAIAKTVRCVGDEQAPTEFSTWCAKAIALIGKLPPTLADRSINIAMRRKVRAEKVERLRHSVLATETSELQRKAARWANDNVEALRVADPSVPDTLNDRAADCWRPLLAIADRVGGSWPERARAAALTIAKDSEDTSVGAQLLADIRTMFGSASKLTSEVIVEELAKMEDRPWPEWKNGKPMSKAQLARQLGRFDIKPGTIRIDDKTAKGYDIAQFSDAFSRYEGIQNVTTSQPTPDVGLSPNSKRHTNPDVTLCKTSQPTPVLHCDVVTFSKGESTEEDTI